jgi:hypothetical protein
MITLFNPTSKTVSVTFEGTIYSITSHGTIAVFNNVAEFWLMIHTFLTVQSGTIKQVGLDTIGGGQSNVPATETPVNPIFNHE